MLFPPKPTTAHPCWDLAAKPTAFVVFPAGDSLFTTTTGQQHQVRLFRAARYSTPQFSRERDKAGVESRVYQTTVSVGSKVLASQLKFVPGTPEDFLPRMWATADLIEGKLENKDASFWLYTFTTKEVAGAYYKAHIDHPRDRRTLSKVFSLWIV